MSNIKTVNAQQAKDVHLYRNIKGKLFKTNASIWFNTVCRTYHLTPNYVCIKVNETNYWYHNAANTSQLNQELISLYVKKQKLIEQLYPFKMREHKAWFLALYSGVFNKLCV